MVTVDREPPLTQLQVEKVEVLAAVQPSPVLIQLEILLLDMATAAEVGRRRHRDQVGQRPLRGEDQDPTDLSQSVTAS